MQGFFSVRTFLRLAAAAIVLAALIVLISERIENSDPALQRAQVEVTRLVQQSVEVTRLVFINNSTPYPTQTREFTHTPVQLTPTSTNAFLTLLPDGFGAWCLPKESKADPMAIPVTGSVPADAQVARMDQDVPTLYTQVKSCTFLFTFNQNLPTGIHMQIQDLNPQPFVDVELQPAADLPNAGYATVNHLFVIDPPYWEVSYTVKVISPAGEVLWSTPVKFMRNWNPQPCSDGTMPDPISLQCKNSE